MAKQNGNYKDKSVILYTVAVSDLLDKNNF